MSYKISYGVAPKIAESKKKVRLQWPIFAIVAIIVALLARTVYPAQTKQFAETLFPLTSTSSKDALDVFTQKIRAGETFGEAATAFCLEIIYEGEAD